MLTVKGSVQQPPFRKQAGVTQGSVLTSVAAASHRIGSHRVSNRACAGLYRVAS